MILIIDYANLIFNYLG